MAGTHQEELFVAMDGTLSRTMRVFRVSACRGGGVCKLKDLFQGRVLALFLRNLAAVLPVHSN